MYELEEDTFLGNKGGLRKSQAVPSLAAARITRHGGGGPSISQIGALLKGDPMRGLNSTAADLTAQIAALEGKRYQMQPPSPDYTGFAAPGYGNQATAGPEIDAATRLPGELEDPHLARFPIVDPESKQIPSSAPTLSPEYVRAFTTNIDRTRSDAMVQEGSKIGPFDNIRYDEVTKNNILGGRLQTALLMRRLEELQHLDKNPQIAAYLQEQAANADQKVGNTIQRRMPDGSYKVVAQEPKPIDKYPEPKQSAEGFSLLGLDPNTNKPIYETAQEEKREMVRHDLPPGYQGPVQPPEEVVTQRIGERLKWKDPSPADPKAQPEHVEYVRLENGNLGIVRLQGDKLVTFDTKQKYTEKAAQAGTLSFVNTEEGGRIFNNKTGKLEKAIDPETGKPITPKAPERSGEMTENQLLVAADKRQKAWAQRLENVGAPPPPLSVFIDEVRLENARQQEAKRAAREGAGKPKPEAPAPGTAQNGVGTTKNNARFTYEIETK